LGEDTLGLIGLVRLHDHASTIAQHEPRDGRDARDVEQGAGRARAELGRAEIVECGGDASRVRMTEDRELDERRLPVGELCRDDFGGVTDLVGHTSGQARYFFLSTPALRYWKK